jgi:hypothetical protein
VIARDQRSRNDPTEKLIVFSIATAPDDAMHGGKNAAVRPDNGHGRED